MAGLIDTGAIIITPITYEDFLPVSAAGIFQSNLGNNAQGAVQTPSNQKGFEAALGCAVADAFALYAETQTDSLINCRRQLGL